VGGCGSPYLWGDKIGLRVDRIQGVQTFTDVLEDGG